MRSPRALTLSSCPTLQQCQSEHVPLPAWSSRVCLQSLGFKSLNPRPVFACSMLQQEGLHLSDLCSTLPYDMVVKDLLTGIAAPKPQSR